MQVRYQPLADRVLWQLTTHGGELFGVWLTRRMLAQLWAPLQQLVAQSSVGVAARPVASVLPEARDMLAQAVRERPLPNAEFGQPFQAAAKAQPLGPEPLLPEAVDIGPLPTGRGIQLRVREQGGRQLSLQMAEDLSTALVRLMEQALAESGWGIAVAPTQAAQAPTRH